MSQGIEYSNEVNELISQTQTDESDADLQAELDALDAAMNAMEGVGVDADADNTATVADAGADAATVPADTDTAADATPATTAATAATITADQLPSVPDTPLPKVVVPADAVSAPTQAAAPVAMVAT